MTQPAVYAEQGVPYFWRIDAVDGNGPELQTYRLVRGSYVLDAEFGPGESGAVEHPWRVRIDMAEFELPGR